MFTIVPEKQEFTITPAWVQAGKAIFTVSNNRGEHYTYKVSKGKDESKPPIWFVALLTGQDNESDYTYMGVLSPQTGDVRLTRASRYTADSVPYRVIRWALAQLWAETPLPVGYAIAGEGRCGRCGRLLTHPDGVNSDGYRLGYGPECYKHVS